MLKVDRLSVAIGGIDILENITFNAQKGEYIGIVGENGSGKSTLVKAILGLVPKKSGTVEILPDAHIGYLPQQTQVKNFPASVSEVVLSGCIRRGTAFYTKADKELANKNLRRLGALHLAKKQFVDLSGGEKQRVLLARAMCSGSDMLVLDEPVTGLDPVITDEMYACIREFNAQKNVTVLMVSHDIAAAAKYSTKILHIGKTVRFFGTGQEYAQSEIGIHFTGRCCQHV